MGHGVRKVSGAVALALLLPGCLSEGQGTGGIVARLKAPDTLAPGKPSHTEKVYQESVIIQGLVRRQSVLPSGGPYDQVAGSVLAANARTAEAELRAARLRSEAASKNWLPRIGPQISLTSLSSVVANLVVDQVLFDNGRLKGERAFAVADVEVAAVSLAQDTNERVATALGLYLTAAEARERAALADQTLKDMERFEYVMAARVRGGVSDRSDLNVLQQKLAEIRADALAQSERGSTALAELNAMSVQPLGGVRGAPGLAVKGTAAQPLSVVQAEAEKTRAIAAAKVERAGHLPGLSAGGTVGKDSSFGLQVKSDQLLGLGTGASLEAIEAAKEAAGRRVAQATEDANREVRKLEGQIAAKGRQAEEASVLTAQAKANLDLFQRQYDAGQRQVMDVVGVYETFARQQEQEVGLRFDALRLQVRLAEILGVLADGDAI